MLIQLQEPGQTERPSTPPQTYAIGIDLGTTNSVVAISCGQKPRVLTNPQGQWLIPSVVAYRESGPVVGTAAQIAEGQEYPTVASIKRLMGRRATEVASYGWSLASGQTHAAATESGGMVRLQVGAQVLTPVEISATILRHLADHAATALNHPITQAVITVPAYFDDGARTATRDAARLAGLEVLRLVNEPTAAALAYGLERGAEGLYVIYDLGGGTFDVSLLNLQRGVFQVLATGGDTVLGGDDIDHLILHHLLAERSPALMSLSPAEHYEALQIARQVKETLSKDDVACCTLVLKETRSTHTISRQQLEALIQPLIARTLQICQEVLQTQGPLRNETPSAASQAPYGPIQGVVLVGGSTRIPAIRQAVEDFFGRPPLTDINPDQAVALGAALQAESLTVGSDTLLLDVTPLSLGLETMGGMVERIIERHSPLPCQRTTLFTTYQDGQTALKLHIVQGEREFAQDCRSLASFELRGIPPLKAGEARIAVTFTLDANGILTVEAQELTTQISQTIEVMPSYGLTPGEMEAMLKDSQAHGAQDLQQRLWQETVLKGERLLQDLQELMARKQSLLTPAARTQLLEAIQGVQAALQPPFSTAPETLERPDKQAQDSPARQEQPLGEPGATFPAGIPPEAYLEARRHLQEMMAALTETATRLNLMHASPSPETSAQSSLSSTS